MKYKEDHEKRFPSKGEALKERWGVYQDAQKARKAAGIAEPKSSGPTGMRMASEEQTKTGEEAKTEEIKTEEVPAATGANAPA